MPTILSTATIVQASGIENTTVNLQGGGPNNLTHIIAGSGIESRTELVAHGSISNSNEVSQFEGISQTGDIINPSSAGTTSPAHINVFPASFSRGAHLFAVLGTTGTLEAFFDRSPFFFTPSEIDPNTLRDISEAQQFMVFSTAVIRSFDTFRNIEGSASLVSAKADEFSFDSIVPENLISNPSFELNLSGWDFDFGDSGDFLSIVTSQPTGVGFDDSNPVSVPDGQKMAFLRRIDDDGVLVLFNKSSTPELNSSELGNFSFQITPSIIDNTRGFAAALVFMLDGELQHSIRYGFDFLVEPSPLPGPPTATGIVDPLDTKTIPRLTQDVFNIVVRDLSFDTGQADFDFDEIQVWFIMDSPDLGNFSILLDDVQVTRDSVPNQLLRTKNIGHILNAHPTVSGLPFTISGSDDITQIDLSGPFFDETNPASGTLFNDPDTQVHFHVKDLSSPLTSMSESGFIDVRIDGELVVDNGAVVSTSTWPTGVRTDITTSDIEYVFTRDSSFTLGATVTVSGEFTDLAVPGNTNTEIYTFQIRGEDTLSGTITALPDADPPVNTPIDPASSATDVSPDTDIIWTAIDNATGVDSSTVKLILNGSTKVDGTSVFDGVLNSTGNADDGFTFTYTPNDPFNFGETITGTLQAADFVPNTGTLSYEFTITSDDTLSIINFFLDAGESTLLTSGTNISVDVLDETHGVAVSGTFLTINGETPTGLTTVTSGAGPDRLTFSVPAEPLVNFREDLTVFVHAENQFPGAFPVIQEASFTLRPGYDAIWPNREIDGSPEVDFPKLTNIQVLADIKNFAKNFNEGNLFFRFLTEDQPRADLGAVIISNIVTADLPAAINGLSPFFEYGKTIILEIEADDLEGNQLRFTHTFIIEENPN